MRARDLAPRYTLDAFEAVAAALAIAIREARRGGAQALGFAPVVVLAALAAYGVNHYGVAAPGVFADWGVESVRDVEAIIRALGTVQPSSAADFHGVSFERVEASLEDLLLCAGERHVRQLAS